VERTLGELAAADVVEAGEHEGRIFWNRVRDRGV